jgi:hypothetical protein
MCELDLRSFSRFRTAHAKNRALGGSGEYMTHIMLLIGEHARQRSRQSELDLARTPGVWLTVDNNADVATP